MASPVLIKSMKSEAKCHICSGILKTPTVKDTGTVKCPTCRNEVVYTENGEENSNPNHSEKETETRAREEADNDPEVDCVVKEFEGKVVKLEGIKRDGWGVNDITSCTVGIIVSGAKVGKSLIGVFNDSGDLLSHIEPLTDCVNYKPWRYCSFLTEAKVVSVCQPNEIGIFDIFLKTNVKRKIISQENAAWQVDRVVSCITTVAESDAGRGSIADRIFVGGKYCRDIAVFDDDLNFIRTLTLPETVAWPKDMTTHNGVLVVCDLQGKRACAVNISEGALQTGYDFPKPNGETAGWAPISVCTVKTGGIFILWKATLGTPSRILVQYSPNGSHKLTEQSVHKDARCLSSFESDEGEKLLVATFACGNIYVMEHQR